MTFLISKKRTYKRGKLMKKNIFTTYYTVRIFSENILRRKGRVEQGKKLPKRSYATKPCNIFVALRKGKGSRGKTC
jgi:hypothetical protein